MEPTPRKPLRLWPGVVAAVLIVLLRFVVPLFVPDAAVIGVMGALAGSMIILLWWVFFSRANWSERVGAIVSGLPTAEVVSLKGHAS